MKKILVLNGSPHEKGCTAALAEAVSQAAGKSGADIKSFFLNDMYIKGCQGCNVCKESPGCAVQDDMQKLYDEITLADGIVFATPVYMWQMSAQLKLVYDRLFAYLGPNHATGLNPGKKVLIAVTQGQPDTGIFRGYFEEMGRFLSMIGFGEYRLLIAGGTHQPEELLSQTDKLQEAEKVGRWLAE